MQQVTEAMEIEGISPELACFRYSIDGWSRTTAQVPSEMELAVYVNSQELVTLLCTPTKLNCLVLGFLYAEGIISGTRDVVSMRVCMDDSLADVKLANPGFQLPTLRTLTSGCGGGATQKAQGQHVDSNIVVEPAEVLSLMKKLLDRMEMYRASGGVHGSALADTSRLLVVSEDIGRHNTLDKIQGECLLRNLSTKDKVLLSTGRVASEMILKAAKMRVPVVVSRTSPTERAVALAQELGVTVVGYARAGRFTVYAHPERLGASV